MQREMAVLTLKSVRVICLSLRPSLVIVGDLTASRKA